MATNSVHSDEIIVGADTLENFGAVLWDLRTSLDVKQNELAERMNMLQSQVSQMETTDPDRKKIPKLPNLVLYLNSLGYELVMRPALKK